MNIVNIINFAKPETGSFLVDIILWLVTICSSVGLGVILFTLLLKLITLPFDFVSRSSMRKNSLKMEAMRPELEKLQKQYANDKTLYNQKMMALYKRNGYSMWGACLPTIITLVIFIVAINAFTNYSNYQNRQYFYDMSLAYNNVIYAGLDTDNQYIKVDENGQLIINDDDLFEKGSNGKITVDKSKEDEIPNGGYYIVTTENGYISYKRFYSIDQNGKKVWGGIEYEITGENLENSKEGVLANERNNFLKTSDGKSFSDSGLDAEAFIKEIRQTMSAKKFRDEKASFLWVKNIWVSDSPFKHPVESDWGSFKSSYKYEEINGSSMTENEYKELIAKLGDEKDQANGYFILVALTILTSLALQLITSKSQKAQMELQTVDGQGAQTQKMMTWMMPIMMAIFAFIYTAAFSIYIVISSIFSILSTLAINKIVDIRFKNFKVENQKVRGRVYTPKEEDQPKKPVKQDKNVDTRDFLSGLADKKSPKKYK